MKRWMVTVVNCQTVTVDAETQIEAREIASNKWSQLEKDEDTFTEVEEVD